STYRPPTAAELIARSVYSGHKIIDETKTTTLPTFIRTGDTYFYEKLQHINAMTNEYGIPTLSSLLLWMKENGLTLNKFCKVQTMAMYYLQIVRYTRHFTSPI